MINAPDVVQAVFIWEVNCSNSVLARQFCQRCSHTLSEIVISQPDSKCVIDCCFRRMIAVFSTSLNASKSSILSSEGISLRLTSQILRASSELSVVSGRSVSQQQHVTHQGPDISGPEYRVYYSRPQSVLL